MHRFYWLVNDVVAGCSLPGGSPRQMGGSEFLDTERVEADLAWLRRENISAVLTLTETPLPADAVQRQRVQNLHLPVPDMTAPTPYQIRVALDFVDRARAENRGVVVHCLMGQGRTGTILGAYLIRAGASADDAIQRVRHICPGALASLSQERALAEYFARRDWVL